MTQEEKDLLLRDLCARLPYGTKVKHVSQDWSSDISSIDITRNIIWVLPNTQGLFSRETSYNVEYVKPYLRPLSSMTEEEKKELLNHVLGGEGVEYFHIAHDGSIDGNQAAEQDLYNLNLHWINFGPLTTSRYIDWLNKKMFDYRGLIERGLAISADEFNPYKD